MGPTGPAQGDSTRGEAIMLVVCLVVLVVGVPLMAALMGAK